MKFLKTLIPFILMAVVCCSEKPDTDFSNNQLRVYPNPAYDLAFISFQNPHNESYQLRVFDTKGKIILEINENQGSQNYSISLSGKPKGSYEVILNIGNSILTQRLIKL